MKPLTRTCLTILFFVLYSTSARAEDSVAIRYLDGYPSLNQSTEWINLRVARVSPPPNITEVSQRDVDRFFEQVAAVLTENAVTNDWQLAIPDAPAIEITIELNGKKVTLVSCHTILEGNGNYLVTERGGENISDKDRASVLSKQSEVFRRHRIAFEEILRLTVERTRARLSP
ncbi:MAG TPA: hypothetical protein VEG25_09675 [Burkholderiales bacterium]|nr:hypothetical protein [Burkholderiales bacterium]